MNWFGFIIWARYCEPQAISISIWEVARVLEGSLNMITYKFRGSGDRQVRSTE